MATIPEALAIAIQHHQAGRLQAAEQIYRRILQADPNQAEAIRLLGVIAHQMGRHDVALEYLGRAIGMNGNMAAFHVDLGEAYRALRRVPEAVACYRRALELKPDFVEAQINLGNLLKEQGNPEEAVACYRSVLELKPDSAEAHNNLGVALKNQTKLEEAVACYRRALELKPDFAEAHNNLGNALHEQGKMDEAIASYRRVMVLKPDLAEARYNLGNTLREQGKWDEAITCYRQALELKPDYPDAYSNLGVATQNQGDLNGAVACCRRALELKPDHAEAHIGLSNALKEQERLAEAKTCEEELLRLRPLDPDRQLWRLRMAVLCPAVFDSREAIDEYRRGLLQAVESFPALNLREHLAKLDVVHPPFNLLYHGRDNRPLKEAYARLFRYEQTAGAQRAGAGRPQVGLLVTRRHEGIFLRFWQGMLQRMKTGRFQLVILCTHAGAARLGAAVRDTPVRLLPIPPRLDYAVQAIRAARLDVLYYWEVGTDATNYFLPFFQLAPVQCTSLGIPDTSGIGPIDYYLSSALLEPEDAQPHYTEKLLLAKTLLTCHLRPAAPEIRKPREAFGLRAGQHVYLCAQNLRKFHPDFDAVLAEIVRRDAAGVVVIVQDRLGYMAQRLRRRFAATIPEAAPQMLFLPWQEYADYLSLVSAADVLLDPLYFGGGATSYEALSLGKPIVTWPWRLQAGRWVLACYRKMGIAGCVAGSAEEYIKMAVSLGTNPEHRDAVGREIAAASGELFEDVRAVREHEDIFERLVEQARSG